MGVWVEVSGFRVLGLWINDDERRSGEVISRLNDPRIGMNIRRHNPMSLRTIYRKGPEGHPFVGYPSSLISVRCVCSGMFSSVLGCPHRSYVGVLLCYTIYEYS